MHNTVIRVDDAASVVTKCRQAITSRRDIPEYTYIAALKRTLCVQFLDSGTADDGAKSLSYNLVVPLPSDASIPSGIVADLHDVLTDTSLGYSSHEIKTITEEMYSWQVFIDEAHMNLQGTVANSPHIYVGTLPGNLPVEDIYGYRNGFFLALSVGFCLPLMWRIRDITTEIALGLKDMQELTGLSSNQFWLGHFLSALPLTLVDAALATSVVCLHQEKYRPAGSADTYRKDGSELPTTVPQPFTPTGHARQYLPVHTDTPDHTTYLENADTSLVYASFALFAVCHTLLAFLIACVFPFGLQLPQQRSPLADDEPRKDTFNMCSFSGLAEEGCSFHSAARNF